MLFSVKDRKSTLIFTLHFKQAIQGDELYFYKVQTKAWNIFIAPMKWEPSAATGQKEDSKAHAVDFSWPLFHKYLCKFLKLKK